MPFVRVVLVTCWLLMMMEVVVVVVLLLVLLLTRASSVQSLTGRCRHLEQLLLTLLLVGQHELLLKVVLEECVDVVYFLRTWDRISFSNLRLHDFWFLIILTQHEWN